MSSLKLQLHFRLTNLSRPIVNTPLSIQIKPNSNLNFPQPASHIVHSVKNPCRTADKSLVNREFKSVPNEELSHSISSSWSEGKYSRIVVFGAVSLGVALLLMGFDDQKALAFGPEGPMVEEFWDNMRRYALYALTVSTGAIYTLLQPIVELLKNPISAILILAIFGGSIFLVSQVVTAMVGLSDFSYEYSN